MNGESLFEVTIQGNVSTNSNRELILDWRGKIERSFASLPLSKMDRKKVSVMVEFWISSERLQTRRNDLDNLLEATKFPTSGEEEVHISVKEWN